MPNCIHHHQQTRKDVSRVWENAALLLGAIFAALCSVQFIMLMVFADPLGALVGIPYWLWLIVCLGIVFEMIYLLRLRKEGI